MLHTVFFKCKQINEMITMGTSWNEIRVSTKKMQMKHEYEQCQINPNKWYIQYLQMWHFLFSIHVH